MANYYLENLKSYPLLKKSAKHYIIALPFTFDTETSHTPLNEEGTLSEGVHAWIYQWAFCFKAGRYFSDCITGRTSRELGTLLKELDDFLIAWGEELSCKKLEEYYKSKTGKWSASNPSKTALEKCRVKVSAILYAHNLGYDYEYEWQQICELWDDGDEFFLRPHQPLYVRIGNLDIRDSYVYFNEGLEKVTDKYHVDHPKRVGLVDYDLIRFPDERLDQSDWEYQINDVLGLQEAILADYASYGYSVCNAPLTNTGRARREAKECYLGDPQNREDFIVTYPDAICYHFQRLCFAGGYTHGNREYKDELVVLEDGEYGDHFDLRSSYPSSQRMSDNLYQVGPFEEQEEMDVESFLHTEGYITFGVVRFTDVSLKNPDFGFPYISTSRAIAGNVALRDQYGKISYCSDNGRALWIKGTFELVITDVDLGIILKLYKVGKLSFTLTYQAEAGRLPEWFRKLLDKYFKGKTDLKNIEKELERNGAPIDEIFDAHNNTQKFKNVFNAFYGMTAQDNCKSEIERSEENPSEFHYVPADIDKKLNEYYGRYGGYFSKSSRGFLAYSWGIWTTAYSRKKIFDEIMLCCPYDESAVNLPAKERVGRALYCDTDSLFILSTDELRAKLKAHNDACYERAIKNGDYIIDNNGKIVNYDSFDLEDHFKRFRFLHSKCYAYDDPEGKLHVTVAGVRARKLKGMGEDGKPIYIYKEDEVKDLEHFTDKFTFKECGSTKSLYIKEEYKMRNIMGHMVECGNACVISPTTKKIKDFDLDLYMAEIDYLEAQNGGF